MVLLAVTGRDHLGHVHVRALAAVTNGVRGLAFDGRLRQLLGA